MFLRLILSSLRPLCSELCNAQSSSSIRLTFIGIINQLRFMSHVNRVPTRLVLSIQGSSFSSSFFLQSRQSECVIIRLPELASSSPPTRQLQRHLVPTQSHCCYRRKKRNHESSVAPSSHRERKQACGTDCHFFPVQLRSFISLYSESECISVELLLAGREPCDDSIDHTVSTEGGSCRDRV